MKAALTVLMLFFVGVGMLIGAALTSNITAMWIGCALMAGAWGYVMGRIWQELKRRARANSNHIRGS